jgi:hypothetical protein
VYDEDGRIINEPNSLYQFGDGLSRLLNNFERFLADRKPAVYTAFQRVNSDEEWEDEPHPMQLVVHCTDPHPQIVLEFHKVLKRFFPDDEDVYELLDIVIKMDPRRVEDATERRDCEEFQDCLFA